MPTYAYWGAQSRRVRNELSRRKRGHQPMRSRAATYMPDGTARIHLSRGLFVVVDSPDARDLVQYRWSAVQRRSDDGEHYYAATRHEGRRIYMHALLAQTPAGLLTDHVNGNGLDNRRANLRIATGSQNNANSKARTGRFKGVYLDKTRGKWTARIQRKYLGRYDNEEDAACAYDIAARATWGEFAYLNFPDGAW